MKIKWIGARQHSEWGMFSPDDVIDAGQLGISSEVVEAWVRDGFAELIEASSKKSRKEVKEV